MSYKSLCLTMALAVSGFACLTALGEEPDAELVRLRRLQVAEISQRVAAEGLPLAGFTIDRSGQVLYEFRAEATPEDRACMADICSDVLAMTTAQPRGQSSAIAADTTAVDNVVDALVVLEFEPNNAKAKEIVRRHYLKLRRARRR